MKNKIKKRALAMALTVSMCACAYGAQSEDLIQWTQFCSDYGNATDAPC
ncbi:MAG: hypothetical protein LIO76_03110 [Clostridiales bacterium]|nr:hypothetical protein [Clostridiales bacterium]